jgi:predicted RNA-binding Zn ribbon-like protein
MGLIEIANAYNSDMAVSTAGRGRFTVTGEPIVAVDLINTVAAPGSATAGDLLAGTGLQTQTQWHQEYGGNPRLAFIAAQAAQFLADPANVARLRRCANPACSMIFVAVNPRRSWCAPGVCGNRARVARHYRRAGRA